LTLKFEEVDRPSFTELSKLVLTSTENTLESPKGAGEKRNSKTLPRRSVQENRKMSKAFSAGLVKEGMGAGTNSTDSKLTGNRLDRAKITTSDVAPSQLDDSKTNLMT
jgi:hypothetical protein